MWAVFRRLLAGIGFVIAVAGFAVFVGAAVGVWRVKAETNRRTDALVTQAHSALGAADSTVSFVREVIVRGR